METLARFGYVAKGFVYGAIGILALLAAFSIGGKTTDTTGALHAIAAQPFGQILLAVTYSQRQIKDYGVGFSTHIEKLVFHRESCDSSSTPSLTARPSTAAIPRLTMIFPLATSRGMTTWHSGQLCTLTLKSLGTSAPHSGQS